MDDGLGSWSVPGPRPGAMKRCIPPALAPGRQTPPQTRPNIAMPATDTLIMVHRTLASTVRRTVPGARLGGLGAGWRGRERRRGRPRHRGRWVSGWGGGGGRLGRRGGARGASEGAPGALQRRRFLHVFCSYVRPCMHVWVPGRRPGVPLRCPHRWPAGECAGGVVRNLF